MDRETLIERKIGERLRRRRIELGLTQEQVGRVVGVSYQQIQKFERGANRVSAARLVLIAEILRTDIRWLCGVSEVHPLPLTARPQAGPDSMLPEQLLAQIDNPRVRSAMTSLARAVIQRGRSAGSP